MSDGIPGFYRDVDGETYYRSSHGVSYHYWLIEWPGGDVVEHDETPVAADAAPYGPRPAEREAVEREIGEYEAEEIPFRLRHGEESPRS